MRIEVGERWLGTKSARDSSSRPFKSAYTRSRLFLHAFLGLCVRVQPLSLVDSHRCPSRAGMTFRRTCSSCFPRFSFSRRKKKLEKYIFTYLDEDFIEGDLSRDEWDESRHLTTWEWHFVTLVHPSKKKKKKNWARNGVRKNSCLNIYAFIYLNEDFIEGNFSLIL